MVRADNFMNRWTFTQEVSILVPCTKQRLGVQQGWIVAVVIDAIAPSRLATDRDVKRATGIEQHFPLVVEARVSDRRPHADNLHVLEGVALKHDAQTIERVGPILVWLESLRVGQDQVHALAVADVHPVVAVFELAAMLPHHCGDVRN